MEQFPMKPWVEATPTEGFEPQQEKPILDDPFNDPTFVQVPKDIKEAMVNLQKKASETELPEIRIEE